MDRSLKPLQAARQKTKTTRDSSGSVTSRIKAKTIKRRLFRFRKKAPPPPPVQARTEWPRSSEFDVHYRKLLNELPMEVLELVPAKHGATAFTLKSESGCSISCSLSGRYFRVMKMRGGAEPPKEGKKAYSIAGDASSIKAAWQAAVEFGQWP
jgi:hypothetical protein